MALLDGKAVVITGSGHGIGAACAKGVAARGGAVVINDINAERANKTVAEIKAAGGKAVACVADISKWEEANRLIQTCIDSFGKIDGLVNNAIYYSYGLFKDYDPVGSERSIAVGVMGTLHCAAAAVKPMLAQGSGSIVNTVSGAHMGMPQMGVYGAIKGAAASATYTWSMELAGSGVRVNALSPFAATNDDGAQFLGDPEEDKLRQAIMPKAENNAFIIEFLLSDLSKDINGQLIRSDDDEVYIYTHPALLVPPARRDKWTAEALAEEFQSGVFKGRQVRSGVLAQETLPVDLTGGFWNRLAAKKQ